MGIDVNDDNFKEEVLEEGLPVLVDFWAVWCGHCLRLAPIIEQITDKYSGKLKVCRLSVDDGPNTACKYEIASIPTLAIFKNGKVVYKSTGVLSKEELEANINKHI
jgi:thioredoxin 1